MANHTASIPVLTAKQAQRFWMKLDKSSGPDGCWLWTGSQRGSDSGYGQVRVNYHLFLAHRIAYAWATGEDIDGWTIDHQCHVTMCCNPKHLRKTTTKQNTENRVGPNRANTTGVRGVFKRGHLYGARVRHNGKIVYFGLSHKTIEEAAEAAARGRLELFTHSEMDKAG